MPWGVVAGAMIGAVGSNMAADKQASAQKQAAATQQQMFNTINSQEQPYIQGGYGAENALLYGLGIGGSNGPSGGVPLNQVMSSVGGGWGGITSGAVSDAVGGMGTTASYPTPPGMDYGFLTRQFSPADFLNNLDPGYQFQLQTGGQAIRNQDTPGVGALSGPALKDLMSFNQGMASTGYQNAFNRFTTQQNNIFSRLSAIAGLGQNAATQVGTSGTQLGTGMAQAQAAAGAS